MVYGLSQLVQFWGRGAVVLLILLQAAASSAQPGKIAGRITDTHGAALPGAAVQQVSGTRGASADIDGDFFLLGVEPGWHRLKISAIGYSIVFCDSVEVKSDLATPVEVSLPEQGAPPYLDQIRISRPFRPEGVATPPDSARERRAESQQRVAQPRLPKTESTTGDSNVKIRGSFFSSFPLHSHSSYAYVSRLESAGYAVMTSQSRPAITKPNRRVFITRAMPEKDIESAEYRRQHEEGDANWHLNSGYMLRPHASGWSKFARTIWPGGKPATWFYGDGYHFFGKRVYKSPVDHSGLELGINPVYGYEVISTEDERGTITRFTGGLRLEGGYNDRVRFMIDFRDHMESGNGPYYSRDQLYEDRWAAVDLKAGSSTSYDISESFIQWYGRDLSIAAGRGRFRWGPGQFGNLFLGSRNPPFDYVRFDAVFDEDIPSETAIFYTFLHGFLQSSLPSDTLYYALNGRPRFLNREKYLSAQRLEVRPRGNLLLAFNQGVIYGDRGVQLGYLTPLNFLYSVQHANDDKDNFLMSFDGTWRPTHGIKLYAEGLFDDIIVSEITKSNATNKSAYTVGTQAIVPREFWNKFDLKLEYTHIRPFVYSHFFATNTYTHWYSPLGYTLEPNSEFMNAELTGSFFPFYVSLFASRQNHGANPDSLNAGGSIYLPSGEAKAEAPFLAGRFERKTRLGARVSWEVLENLWMFGEAAAISKSREGDRLETRMGFGWNL